MKALPSIDRMVALLCIVIAGLYLAASFSITEGSFGDPMGPRIFPQLLGGLLIMLCIVTLVQSQAVAEPKTPIRIWLAIGVCVLLVLGFILILPLAGYQVTSFLMLLGFLLVLREQLMRALLVSAGLTLLFHVVFVVLLRTYFPENAFGGVL